MLCSRAVWIYKGKLRLDGDPTYVISKYLEQSAIDNKEEAKQAAESSEHLPRGAVFIDTPVPFQSVALNQPLTINGWSVSNSLDGQVEVLFDEKPIENVTRVPRPDVFKAYQEDYAGFIDEATTGLTTTIDGSLLTEGTHRIEVILRDGKTKRQIDHKTIRIKADANPVNPELDQD